MSRPLTDEELQQYTHLVDAILATADLATVTRKKVRKGLEQALGGKDLSDQKTAIKDLIEARFDAISQSESTGTMPTPPLRASQDEQGNTPPLSKRDYEAIDRNGNDDGRSLVEDEENEDGGSGSSGGGPAKKKHKRSSSSLEDADARLAAELQAQENRLARGRTTRGGGSAKATKPRKTPLTKKKSSARVKDEDGSDVGEQHSGEEGRGPVKEKRKAGGGFQKPFNLSHHLGALVGASQMSRPQVVKKLWEHIKANELQDPTDKRQIRCDNKLQAVFKQHKIDMFQMNKQLGNHLYPIDEE